MKSTGKHAIVIGGSLAGLFAGILLHTIGWEVDIYERSPHKMDSRGGGVVLQSSVVEAFQRAGIPCKHLGIVARERYYLERDGVIRKVPLCQTLTSWNLLYTSLRQCFSDENYHQDKELTRFHQEGKHVVAFFADGTHKTGDLLVGADGLKSTVRQLLLPDYSPQYAGYVAYRGLVDEIDLDPTTAKIFTERFVFYQFQNSHILQYLIPGENNSLSSGERRFNWVWYVNCEEMVELPRILTDREGKRRDYSIPPGMMAPDIENEMRSYANHVLVPPFQKLVSQTKAPFVQAILDLGIPRMVFGRVVLLGDAAFIPRPHTAASVSKAATNAIALADALFTHNHDIVGSLESWETEQLGVGMHFWKAGMDLGNSQQFMYGLGRFN